MKYCKSFSQSICKSSVKLFCIVISCSPLVCCVGKQTKRNFSAQNQLSSVESAVNVNTASAQELEKLPHVGEKIAQRIIEHREKFGSFRKPEHLLLVDGISDARFREMRNFIKVE